MGAFYSFFFVTEVVFTFVRADRSSNFIFYHLLIEEWDLLRYLLNIAKYFFRDKCVFKRPKSASSNRQRMLEQLIVLSLLYLLCNDRINNNKKTPKLNKEAKKLIQDSRLRFLHCWSLCILIKSLFATLFF